MAQPALKNGLNSSSVARMASTLVQITPSFPEQSFKLLATNNLESLELKERIHHIIDALHQTLPKNFKKTAKILTQFKKKWQSGHKDDPHGFSAWAITDYVGVHGIKHPELALPLLQHLTSLFSAEFAIREFIQQYPELTWVQLHQWSEHEDEHVRRLASEGCRPRLPWGKKLQELIDEPMPLISLLDKLKDDNSEYVRRSVANNLNDISKDHPDLVIKICKRWKKNATDQRLWIIRHATRTLVKKGHTDVFSLLGYTKKPQVTLKSLSLSSSQITLGETLEFLVELHSDIKKEQKLVIDYAINYVKANGKSSAKVYKLKNVTLSPNEKLCFNKKQAFKPISTRSFHSGEHSLELLVNGIPYGKKSFNLKT